MKKLGEAELGYCRFYMAEVGGVRLENAVKHIQGDFDQDSMSGFWSARDHLHSTSWGPDFMEFAPVKAALKKAILGHRAPVKNDRPPSPHFTVSW